MNKFKRLAGIIWIILGPVAVYYLIQKIQWGVFVVVFIPIAIGMVLFGYYALKGEYDHLPESSAEITD
jgi:uncharacterized membrane protein